LDVYVILRINDPELIVHHPGDLVEIHPFIDAPGFSGKYAIVVFTDTDKKRALIRFPSGHTFWFMFSQLIGISSVVQPE
jgi:hypothetical protein